jgi:hypothetical protein
VGRRDWTSASAAPGGRTKARLTKERKRLTKAASAIQNERDDVEAKENGWLEDKKEGMSDGSEDDEMEFDSFGMNLGEEEPIPPRADIDKTAL